MNMQKIIKKVIITGVAATIGFGTFAIEGTNTAQAATTTSVGQKVINYGEKYMGTPYKFELPRALHVILTVLLS